MSARRHSPAVYRRRRIAVLLLALLVVGGITAGIVWAVNAQPWRALFADAEPTPSASTPLPTGEPTPAPSGSASPEPSSTPTDAGEPQACDPNAIQVEALTDKDVYAEGEQPQLSIRLVNTGDVDCTFNVGTSQQRFTITSGDDTWWRSTDCQRDPIDMVVTLAAGQEVTSAEPVVWDRTRSAVDTCDSEGRPAAPAGGSSYHLAVEIGGIASTSSRQFILG
ncbi:hypothetical protein ACWDR7_05255 [Microbacterium sp. NPDC003461]